MRIVTNGHLYAIQKGWIFKKYVSLYSTWEWYPMKESYSFCWGEKEMVKNVFRKMAIGKNIKVVDEKDLNWK